MYKSSFEIDRDARTFNELVSQLDKLVRGYLRDDNKNNCNLFIEKLVSTKNQSSVALLALFFDKLYVEEL